MADVINETISEMSLLERSLKISESGGIYYAKARAGVNPNSAFLFVGLGGTGSASLIRIKDQVKNRMVLPVDQYGSPIGDTPDNIGFLEIDSDKKEEQTSYGNVTFSKLGDEFCCIGVDGVAKVIEEKQKARQRGDEEWQWLDEDISPAAGKDGAGGVRQIGRFLLACNINEVVRKVRGKITSLLKNKQINDLRIFVFGGISGGTGAGTFLDMGYILRKEGLSMVPNVNVMGYLVMTDVNEQKGGRSDNLRANGFACLKELDYWMSQPDHKQRYIQRFPGYTLNEADRPFDFCHLIDASDAAGHIFTYPKILQSLAENVYCYVSGEVGGPLAENVAMTQLYNNVKQYMPGVAANADYPAAYEYLALGAAKIEIPYMEISTWIAARVFERLDAGMFRRRPSENEFYQIVENGLGMSESMLKNFLYPKSNELMVPGLSPIQYTYETIWPNNNTAYWDVYNYVATFQEIVNQKSGVMAGELEGRLRQFLKVNMVNKEMGPVYLSHFIKSNESMSLVRFLTQVGERCKVLVNQEAENSTHLQEQMRSLFMQGAQCPRGKRKAFLAAYLNTVDAWRVSQECYYLYGKLKNVLDKVVERFNLYHKNIYKPLADMLLAIPPIFRENMEILRDQEKSQKNDEGTMVLIKPSEFENVHKNEFEKLVIDSEAAFLDSLSQDIVKWIGREIDEVDENINGNVDVAGFISTFISENFSVLLNINMEEIIRTKLKNGDSIENFVQRQVDFLLAKSYSMYKEDSAHKTDAAEFSIISVPSDCPTILSETQKHIKRLNLDNKVTIKVSEEKSRFYIIKVSSGYPLYSNAFLRGMEEAYENQMSDAKTCLGKHLYPHWGNYLPSPYIEVAWDADYTCSRTSKRNRHYRDLFEKCWDHNILVEMPEGGDPDHLELKLSNLEVASRIDPKYLTADSVLEKKVQLETLWSKHTSGEILKLRPVSNYMKGRKDINWVKVNVRENVLRFPEQLEILEKECHIIEQYEMMSEELEFPAIFARAEVNKMINISSMTRNVRFQSYDGDPLAIQLINGTQLMPEYIKSQIYEQFCKYIKIPMELDQKELKKRQETKKRIVEEISLQFENRRKSIEENPNELPAYLEELKALVKEYSDERDKAKKAVLRATMETKESFVKKIQFYSSIVDEIQRMMPDSAGGKSMGMNRDGSSDGNQSFFSQQMQSWNDLIQMWNQQIQMCMQEMQMKPMDRQTQMWGQQMQQCNQLIQACNMQIQQMYQQIQPPVQQSWNIGMQQGGQYNQPGMQQNGQYGQPGMQQGGQYNQLGMQQNGQYGQPGMQQGGQYNQLGMQQNGQYGQPGMQQGGQYGPSGMQGGQFNSQGNSFNPHKN